MNPVPRVYTRGFGIYASRNIVQSPPLVYTRGFLWYGLNGQTIEVEPEQQGDQWMGSRQ